MTETANEFMEKLHSARGWEDKLRLILKLATELEPYPEEEKTPENTITDCIAEVYFCGKRDPSSHHVHFFVSSEVRILKGVVAVLLLFCQDQHPEQLSRLDLESIVDELGLKQRLSGTRHNALNAIIQRIRMAGANT